MAIERMEFAEAMKHLAERVGIPLPEMSDQAVYQQKQDEKQLIAEINRECAKFYYQMLIGTEGKQALDYLRSRGLSMDIIRSFGLGFAPDSWEAARDYLNKLGYTDQQLINAGIVVESAEKGRIYDRFRNRVMFPIINTRGMVLGFGGRVMDDSMPKYLNSSDSPVFNKALIYSGLTWQPKSGPWNI